MTEQTTTNHWERCPVCGDHNIEGGSIDIESRGPDRPMYATQAVSCVCGASWTDTYQGLSRIVDRYRCSRCGKTGSIGADFGTLDGELLCRPRCRTIDEPCYTRRLRAIEEGRNDGT